jgi:hypothetical protein
METDVGVLRGGERVLSVNGVALPDPEFTGVWNDVQSLQIDNGGALSSTVSTTQQTTTGPVLTSCLPTVDPLPFAAYDEFTCDDSVFTYDDLHVHPRDDDTLSSVGELQCSTQQPVQKQWDDGVRDMQRHISAHNSTATSIDPHLFDHQPYDPNCAACRRAKARIVGQTRVRDTVQSEKEKAKQPGERQIVDLCGPFPNSPEHHNFMFVGVDEASDLYFVEPLRGKTPAGVVSAIAKFKSLMEEFREWQDLPKSDVWKLKSDLGSEFIADETRKYMAETFGFQENVVKGRHISKIENTIREISNGTRA